VEESNLVSWSPVNMLEITLAEPDDFLKVRETLTRIGVASRRENKLFQSCHILHKQGRYYIVHFKELFMLDGKKANLEQTDVERRNTIATLLSDWGLVEIQNNEVAQDCAPLRQIKIIGYKEKDQWELCPKYNIGNK
jgi:hypothetical protein